MIAYTGHPDYRWCYVSNDRNAAKGYLVGILPIGWYGTHEVVPVPPGCSAAYGHQVAEALGLKRVEIDGFGLDGDMVFHGKPLIKRIDTFDCSGVFHSPGDYSDHPPIDRARRWFIFNDLIDCLHDEGREVHHIPTLRTRFGKVFDSYGIA